MPARVVSNQYSYANADSISNYRLTSAGASEVANIGYDTDTSGYNNGGQHITMIKNTRGIYGIPYQFLPTVDPRISGTDLGAKYAEKIVAKMPLLFLTPCKQKFMDGYDQNTKSTFLSALLSGEQNDLLNQVVSKNGKYYKTVFMWDEYYKYINSLCAQLAIYMGLDNVKIPTNNGEKKIEDINWATDLANEEFNNLFLSLNKQDNGYINARHAVVYYLDGSSVSSMSESFGNSTTESSLASQLNGYSETINEIKFLVGEDNALVSSLQQAAGDLSKGFSEGLEGIVSNFAGGMLADLAGKGTSSIISGGKLVFPKLWQDSSFARSYSFDIKLRSPDHDNLSIFLNIMVPFIHLLALVLPVAHEDNANSYNAPFLVKGYCKGLFNIDMGMITDMSVTRGAECQWNDDGLPTQMDISISIEDLYSSLYMSALNNATPPLLLNRLKDSISLVQNTTMMDYLANLGGLNLADEQLARSARMLVKLVKGTTASGIRNDIYNTFDRAITNRIKFLYQ